MDVVELDVDDVLDAVAEIAFKAGWPNPAASNAAVARKLSRLI